jgi:hypothetical protein
MKTDEDSSQDVSHSSCLDYLGKTVLHSMKFTPPNDDNCKWCYCEDGHAEVIFILKRFDRFFTSPTSFQACQSVWCEPPKCKSFSVGTLCCDFTCLDNELFFGVPSFLTIPVILTTFVSILLIVAFWCIYRFKKSNTRRQEWEDVAKVPSIVISENLYLEMSVDIIEKNDQIDQLRKKISLLQHQLSYVESSKRAEDEV